MFYFLSWFWWIYTVFIMDKKRMKIFLSSIILLLIIASNTYISFLTFDVYLGGIVFFIVGVYLLITHSCSKFLSIIYSIILSMIYCIFHFIELYDPYWIMIFPNRLYLLSIVLTLACCIASFDLQRKMGILLAGTFYGEFILSIFLRSLGFDKNIGTIEYLSVVSQSLTILIIIHIIKKYYHILIINQRNN